MFTRQCHWGILASRVFTCPTILNSLRVQPMYGGGGGANRQFSATVQKWLALEC